MAAGCVHQRISRQNDVSEQTQVGVGDVVDERVAVGKNNRGPYRVNQYRPRTDAQSLADDLASHVLIAAYWGHSRFSSHTFAKSRPKGKRKSRTLHDGQYLIVR